jgi:hypothetical protein
VTTIVNLTPHTIALVGADGQTREIAPGGPAARVVMDPPIPAGVVTIDGMDVPIVSTSSAGQVTGLPQPQPGTLFLVSLQVAKACPDRDDLVVTNDAVRGDGGQIIGCRSLAKPA